MPEVPEGNHNLESGCGRESERPTVAKKPPKGEGAKGPHFSHVSIIGRRTRLSRERSITECANGGRWCGEFRQAKEIEEQLNKSEKLKTGIRSEQANRLEKLQK